MFEEDKSFTVSQLNTLIRDVVNMGFPQGIWVCGEIQGYDRNRSRNHIFFDLCEKDPGTKDIVAKIGLVIFSGRKNHIQSVLKQSENAFKLKDDIEVRFFCKVDFYPPHGAMRLIVESIDPVYTLGKIAQEKQRLIALLKEGGVLEKNKELELPLVPLNIGLITAYDSAAYNDFLDELKESGFGFKVFYKKALMQGKKAEGEVCSAIGALNKISKLDVIVITRGGGSISDLSCFDSEKIAKKIASSNLPVLSGIGHEINITITDMAANVYQKTPTAIAQFLVDRVNEFLVEIEEKAYEVIDFSRSKLNDEKKNLRKTALELRNCTNYYLKSHSQEIERFIEIVKRQPLKLIKGLKSELKGQKDLFNKVVKVRIINDKKRLGEYERLMGVVDPKNTLKRGFTITRTDSGQLVKNIKNMCPGDNIETQLVDGIIDSKVVVIKKTK